MGKQETESSEDEDERNELIPILDKDTVCPNGRFDDHITEMTVDDTPTELEPHLTLFSTVLFAVGQVIGSGIFVSPNEVVKQVGSPGMALTIWVVSGLISLCGALSFSELGTLISRSGGEYQYLRAAYGKLVAFLYMWVCGVLRNSMGCAVIALTFSSYLAALFISVDHAHFEFAKKAGAASAIVIIIAVNSCSTKYGVRMVNFFCVLKIAALIVLILLGAWKLSSGETENINVGFKGSELNPAVWTTAFFAALWSYSGWNCINVMSGEIKNPKKNLPRALVISQFLLITLFVMANIAYCSILTLAELNGQEAIALTVGKNMFGKFGDRWGRFGEIFFGVSVAISSFGSLSSSLIVSSRLPFIAAQEGMFPKCVALIQTRTGTPIVGLIYIGIAAFLCVWPSNISHLIGYVGFLSWFWWGLCFLAVPVLRWKMPDCPRKFKICLVVPIVAFISTVYLVVGPFFVNFLPTFSWVLLTLLGVPIYYGYIDDEKSCSRWMERTVEFLAKLLKAEL